MLLLLQSVMGLIHRQQAVRIDLCHRISPLRLGGFLEHDYKDALLADFQ